VCVKSFRHWITKKVIRAEDHGHKAFCFCPYRIKMKTAIAEATTASSVVAS